MFKSMPLIITESLTECNSVLQQMTHSDSLFNDGMKTSAEIRLENLLALIELAGGEDALAKRYECTPAFIKQMSRGYKDSKSGSDKGIGDLTARKLETCMGMDRGWLDHDHELAQATPAAIAAAKTIDSLDDKSREEVLHYIQFKLHRKEHQVSADSAIKRLKLPNHDPQ